MTTTPSTPLPFHIGYDTATGRLVLTMTFGVPPHQKSRTTAIPSLEQVAVEIALHRHESRLQHQLAQALVSAAVDYLGANPGRLEEAVQALSDPASQIPVSRILRGPAPTV